MRQPLGLYWEIKGAIGLVALVVHVVEQSGTNLLYTHAGQFYVNVKSDEFVSGVNAAHGDIVHIDDTIGIVDDAIVGSEGGQIVEQEREEYVFTVGISDVLYAVGYLCVLSQVALKIGRAHV